MSETVVLQWLLAFLYSMPPNTNRAKLKRKPCSNRRNVNPCCVTGIRIHHLSLMDASSTWHGVMFFNVRWGTVCCNSRCRRQDYVLKSRFWGVIFSVQVPFLKIAKNDSIAVLSWGFHEWEKDYAIVGVWKQGDVSVQAGQGRFLFKLLVLQWFQVFL